MRRDGKAQSTAMPCRMARIRHTADVVQRGSIRCIARSHDG